MAESDKEADTPGSPVQGLTQAEAFTLRINDIVKSGFISLGLALGSSLGLFHTMCELNKPATSQDIANAAGCKERYVREWLYFMAAAEVVEMSESGEELFYLPPDHRAGVTAPEEGSLAKMAVHSTLMASTFDPLLKCFRKDGPLGISSEHTSLLCKYWEVQKNSQYMIYKDSLLKKVPALEEQLERGIQVLDIGGGKGQMTLVLAQAFPKSTFYSCDIRQNALDEATNEAQELSLHNIHFLLASADALPGDWTKKFDFLLMIDTLHDLPFPIKATQEAYRVLKPNCYMSVIDVFVDSDPRVAIKGDMNYTLYAYSLFYCLSSSLSVPGSVGLGTAAGNQKLMAILREAGFANMQLNKIQFNSHIICQKTLKSSTASDTDVD